MPTHSKTKEKRISLSILNRYKQIDYLNKEGTIVILETKDKKYLIERKGKCKQCGQCCKFVSVTVNSVRAKYWSGFGTHDKNRGAVFIDKPCSRLKGNKCSIFKDRSKFSLACKQFPHPTDEVYWRVMKTCGFYFEILMTEKKEAKAKCGKDLKGGSSAIKKKK